MNKSMIIDQAQRRTQRRADNELHMGQEYVQALQDVCQESHFYWRKKYGTFSTVDNTAVYDLSSDTYGAMTDLSEIARVYIVNSDGSVEQMSPVVESSDQVAAIADTRKDKPSQYMAAMTGNAQEIRLSPVPNGIYAITVVYYAIPVIDQDDADEDIPLVPAPFHGLIWKRMELNILEYLFGPESNRYVSCQKEYARMLDKATDLGKEITVEGSRQVVYPQNAIRSTN